MKYSEVYSEWLYIFKALSQIKFTYNLNRFALDDF